MKDAHNRENLLLKDMGSKKVEFPDEIDELVLKYGSKYDFLNCFYYKTLN